MLWLTLAAKMLNTNLRIYSTKCIDPIKPMDVHDVPLPSSVGGPTLKGIRVTSAVCFLQTPTTTCYSTPKKSPLSTTRMASRFPLGGGN